MEYKYKISITSLFLGICDREFFRKNSGVKDPSNLININTLPGEYHYRLTILKRDGHDIMVTGFVNVQDGIVLGDVMSCIQEGFLTKFTNALHYHKATKQDGRTKPIALIPIWQTGEIAVELTLSACVNMTHKRGWKRYS